MSEPVVAHGTGEPSSWVTRWAPAVPASASVLDLACGHGRHARWWAARGHAVTAVDRDAQALQSLAGVANLECLQADLEQGAWLLSGRQFELVIVTNYLWRPCFDELLANVAPGGLLLYETFTAGHEALGRPSRPEFLLQPAELLQRCAGWQVLGFEEGLLQAPMRLVQRIAARRPAAGESAGRHAADILRRALPETALPPG